MKGAWWILAALLCAAGGQAVAQEEGKAPWEEYDKLIGSRTAVTTLGPDLLGDNVDLASGALSFGATDVSLPGNNALAVAVGRSFSVTNRKGYWQHDLPFADWDLDVPRISGVFAGTWHNDRCSGSGPPPTRQVSGKHFDPSDYWQGNQAKLPGGGEMLQVGAATPKPTSGGPYPWMTAGQTFFSCLPGIKNGSGQGFLAVTADGTKYWFDWMAQYFEPQLDDKNDQGQAVTLPRRKNVLYATRVEDRFGNWVTYTYTNASTAAARLTAINASDGRRITLGYNANGHIGSVSDGSQTWTYQYRYPSALKGTLTGVVLPDGSAWAIDFADFSSATFRYLKSRDPDDFVRNCFNPGDLLNATSIVGTVSHPSGAKGTFTVFPQRHGRSNVPALCGNYSTPYNDPNDDVAYYPINWDAFSLTKKQLSGPGLVTGTWTYSYGSAVSWFYPPSGNGLPLCGSSAGCEAPQCTSDACAGTSQTVVTEPDNSWTRYTFGNSYRYNEGKLLKMQRGTGSTTLYTERLDYVLAQSGQPFPTPIGHSPQARGDGFTSEYMRPMKRKEIVQDGASFVHAVNAFDAFARPTKITRSSTGTGGNHVDPPQGVPTLTAPATNSSGSYTVSWNGIGGTDRYELYWRQNGGSWSRIHNSAGTSKSVSGQGTGAYGYKARACNAGGCGSYSAVKTTQVTRPPSGAPTLTAPASNTSGSYTVSWTAVSAATRYELYSRRDNGSWSRLYNGAGTSQALSGVAVGTYDQRVRACNTGGCGSDSAIKTTVVGPPPSAPPPASAPVLSVPAAADPGVAYGVSWTAVSTATVYVLEENANGAGWAVVSNGSGRSVSRTLFSGSNSYRVKACNAAGCSAFSPTKTVTERSSGCPLCQPDGLPDEGEGEGQ